MSALKIDDLKLFMTAHQKLKDSEEGCINCFDDSYKRIERAVHKGLWYFGPDYYCLFVDATYVCKMSTKEIEQLIDVFLKKSEAT